MKQEHVVRSVVHEGWAINVKVSEADASGPMQAVAEVHRDGITRCRIVVTECFATKERMAAVLIAKADKWISAQAGFGPLR